MSFVDMDAINNLVERINEKLRSLHCEVQESAVAGIGPSGELLLAVTVLVRPSAADPGDADLKSQFDQIIAGSAKAEQDDEIERWKKALAEGNLDDFLDEEPDTIPRPDDDEGD